jgi:trimeric autotransporter adhesin
MATNPTLVRADALNLTTDLAQAGAVYNDATRLLDGGLWSQPADAANQQAYLGMYTTDITAVSDDIAAMLANPAAMTIGGVAYTPTAADTATLTQIQSQLQTLLTTAPNAVGNSHAAITAQETLHTVQTEILNEIAGDTALAQALGNVSYLNPGTGANDVGFQALPTGADDAAALAAATAPNATLASIGQVFNAAADLAVGGLNHTNLHEFNTDMAAIAQGVSNILNNPTELGQIEAGETANAAALTTIHLQTVENQIQLQMDTFDKEYASNPNVAARSTNDNLLDIIDIIQNDANLNTNAGGNGAAGHVGGFAEMPGYLSGTITHYQDNQTQTNFWAEFIAEANTLNNTLQAVANGTSTVDIGQLITQVENYNSFGANFAHGQGGIFGARFLNELTDGTLKADSAAAVQGLTGILNGDTGAALAHDQAQILAAGQGFVADANDVSGNNTPIGGGTYVGTATTVATATSVNGIAQGTIPVTAHPDIANGTGSGGGAGAGGPGHDIGPPDAGQWAAQIWHHG